jgi:hypothetical protein
MTVHDARNSNGCLGPRTVIAGSPKQPFYLGRRAMQPQMSRSCSPTFGLLLKPNSGIETIGNSANVESLSCRRLTYSFVKNQ